MLATVTPMADGMASRGVDVELAVRTLSALFFGMPLASHCSGLNLPTHELWHAQLNLVWAGLRNAG